MGGLPGVYHGPESHNAPRPHGDGDGERCVTPARTAAKETTSNTILLKSRKSNL